MTTKLVFRGHNRTMNDVEKHDLRNRLESLSLRSSDWVDGFVEAVINNTSLLVSEGVFEVFKNIVGEHGYEFDKIKERFHGIGITLTETKNSYILKISDSTKKYSMKRPGETNGVNSIYTNINESTFFPTGSEDSPKYFKKRDSEYLDDNLELTEDEFSIIFYLWRRPKEEAYKIFTTLESNDFEAMESKIRAVETLNDKMADLGSDFIVVMNGPFFQMIKKEELL